jgi:hypothetical protein
MLKTTFIFLLFTTTAFANTAIIPSPFKQKRILHQSAAAAAFSDRNVVGLDYIYDSFEETKVAGVLEDEVNTDTIRPFVLARVNEQVVIEAEYVKSDVEETDVLLFSTREYDEKALNANVGVKILPTTALGFGYSNDEYDTDEDTTISLSAVHQLGQLYVGGGIAQTEYDPSVGEEDKSYAYHAGVGATEGVVNWEAFLKIFSGDREGHQLNGLVLLKDGLVDYFAALNVFHFEGEDGLSDYDATFLTLGLDYDFVPNFYVAPSLIFYRDKNPDKTEGAVLELEVGYRANDVNLYIAYNASKVETKSLDSESEGDAINLGVSYSFK